MLSPKYCTIKHVLLQQLQIALDLYLLNQKLYAKPKINLSWNLKNNQITYIWAIALQLSTVQKLPAMQIATMMMHLIDTTENAVSSTSIVTHVAPPGLIYLELTDLTVGSWLQYFTINPPRIEKYCSQKGSGASLSFTLQYTHARCCSVLQLAAQEGLITLRSRVESAENIFPVVSEQTLISFLDSQQRLLCCHPTEQALIKQLLMLFDNLYYPSTESKAQWEKITLNLCQSWQNFYTHCRIWGEVKQNNLLLARARLGLTSLTQSLLAVFLNDKLGVYAPTEL
ncbi:anticodon-binding protein [Gloeocapsopsis crepidinum LEGE 06123]|uniref:Anticodon-binding protein n=1 Tax=Gloeocapsopsis crepidinum LEGE 06123 TaxID=588587 RepID=A0ABR9UMK1_9CHRO|nr:DALR anticodon-binding domain-containing protein [Gloeocapsopsis crepidinum]MBE9189489.1 anticodon-binding protein [Gloeocapsopsis crepidinum LEGE 06123]